MISSNWSLHVGWTAVRRTWSLYQVQVNLFCLNVSVSLYLSYRKVSGEHSHNVKWTISWAVQNARTCQKITPSACWQEGRMLICLQVASKRVKTPFSRPSKPFSFSLPHPVCKWCFDNFILHSIKLRFVIGTTTLYLHVKLSLFHNRIQGNLLGESRNLSEVTWGFFPGSPSIAVLLTNQNQIFSWVF